MSVTVTTLAGCGERGHADGQGADARFNYPRALAIDGDGNLLITEFRGDRIRTVTASGIVSTLAAGHADGQGPDASFRHLVGIAIDGDDNLIVAGDQRIRTVTASGMVSTLAGNGESGHVDGQGAEARFARPFGVAIDGDGNIIVADMSSQRIRKVTASGMVSTLAGSGQAGHADGQGADARFNFPCGIAIDGDGDLFVTEFNGNRIRKVTASGMVSTLAGSGQAGHADGQGADARFNFPAGIAIDGDGNLIVTEIDGHRIRKVTASGMVSTLAGNGESGHVDGQGSDARFARPFGVAIDGDGNIIVTQLHSLRKVDAGLLPPRRPATLASTYVTDMVALLADPQFCDVSFSVGDATITAHRALLAGRSSYFRAMMASGFQEGHADTVIIRDTTPAAFRSLLHYVYSDQLLTDDSSVVDLMRKAHEVTLARLVELCLDYCRARLAPPNAVDWLTQADAYGLDELRRVALAYVRANFRRIRTVARDSIRALAERPHLMLEVVDSI